MSTGKKRPAFTLVELMIVIVIIAILAGLTTVGTRIAIQKTKAATVSLTMEQLSMAIEKYKNDIGEYPPDFTDLDAVTRHVRKRWPRCEYPDIFVNIVNTLADNPNDEEALNKKASLLRRFGWDVTCCGPASSLVFWLGGIPDSTGRPKGFSLSPTDPFGLNSDDIRQREETRYDFPEETIVYGDLESNPGVVYKFGAIDSPDPVTCEGPVFLPGKDDAKPIIYFCASAPAENDLNDINAELENASYQLTLNGEAKYCKFKNLGCAVPYAKNLNMNGYWTWHEPERFQLIHPGQDGLFSGEENYSHEEVSSYPYPCTSGGGNEKVKISDDEYITNNLTQEDDDNIVNFAEGGTLESLYPEK